MTLRTIEPAQRTAAKVVGFIYLFEVTLGIWLLAKGIQVPRGEQRTAPAIAK